MLCLLSFSLYITCRHWCERHTTLCAAEERRLERACGKQQAALLTRSAREHYILLMLVHADTWEVGRVAAFGAHRRREGKVCNGIKRDTRMSAIKEEKFDPSSVFFLFGVVCIESLSDLEIIFEKSYFFV